MWFNRNQNHVAILIFCKQVEFEKVPTDQLSVFNETGLSRIGVRLEICFR